MTLNLVLPRGIEPRPVALQATAHTSYARGAELVEMEGIEPSIEACKATVFPLALHPHYKLGGAEGNRIPDLRIASASLSLLSYGPIIFITKNCGL